MVITLNQIKGFSEINKLKMQLGVLEDTVQPRLTNIEDTLSKIMQQKKEK